MRPFLIGIAGPSCSGKSEVSRRLSRILRAPMVALDHYYKDMKDVPFEVRAKTNFDAPDALDKQLILEHTRKLKEGCAIEQPTYDFARHTRADETEHIRAAEFVILEGLFALHWPEVRALLDARVYITAEHDVCLERRIYRDVRERGRSEESVRAQYEATVRPMCEKYVTPSREHAELVLNGTDPVKQSVLKLLTVIAERIPDGELREAVQTELDWYGPELKYGAMTNPDPHAFVNVHRTFEAAFNAGDLDALAALYEPGAVLLPGAGSEVRGQDAIRDSLAQFLGGRPTMRIQTAWTMETGDGIALVSGAWTLSGVDPAGQVFERSGVSAEVLRRQPDGRWLYILDNPFVA